MQPMQPLHQSGSAAAQINGPAMGLLIAGVVGGLLTVGLLIMNLLGVGMAGLPGMGELTQQEKYMSMMSGGIGIVSGVVGLGVAGFIIWAARRMQRLQGWTPAVVASIVAMVPCVSPCCTIGLPVGIWALVVLMKPGVKSAFQG